MRSQTPGAATHGVRQKAAASRKRPIAKKGKGDGADRTTAEVVSAMLVSRQAAQHADIARDAYFRAERRGFAPGFELDDWLAAEAALNGSAPHANVDDPAGSDAAFYRPDHEV